MSLLWTILSRLVNLLSGRKLLTQQRPTESRNSSLTARLRGRSIFVRHLDTGSSNASELSINALSNPIYDLERLGFHFVASPRHADLLVITGPMTLNLVSAAEATFDAMPEKPLYIVTVGDDASGGGIFQGAYGILGHLPRPDLERAKIGHVPGRAPKPVDILEGLVEALDRAQAAKP